MKSSELTHPELWDYSTFIIGPHMFLKGGLGNCTLTIDRRANVRYGAVWCDMSWYQADILERWLVGEAARRSLAHAVEAAKNETGAT